MEEININLNEMPETVGSIQTGYNDKKILKVKSMTRLKTWVLDKIPNNDHPHNIVISGYMSNCIALHLATWLAGKGTLMYKNQSGLRREVV